jgi:hypothetical protein
MGHKGFIKIDLKFESVTTCLVEHKIFINVQYKWISNKQVTLWVLNSQMNAN